ncbi:hypothetical protein BGW36DRAFT_392907 [Talaromyces proteolyticus]|uniref:NAD-dependent epimerase/dehydratase domain-containing protein n=1 Tax=Talaromyces proteolyticus TaxID=1131652 RepID=A0AAD4Q148_9EURO|nr:uncharacterized protein BGW36DRAFT_392907 [Talaromyces proteolyticus]KAH8705235.1 hypothetical protein BGW36DRAFT_392907 [Talaromyces proteolyticus]
MANKSTILVTGANGFVAAHIIADLLSSGYNVVGTVRSQSSAEKVLAAHKSYNREDRLRISTLIVADITIPGAFDNAVKIPGVDSIIHTASPFKLVVEDNERDLLIPAIQGTKSILESAAKSPQIKKVVITSSFASIVDLSQGLRPGYVYNEKDWNPVTIEEAKKSVSGSYAYCASKKLAEQAAWDFVKGKKDEISFSLTTICPPKIFGPANTSPLPKELSLLGVSMKEIYDLVSGANKQAVPPTRFWGWVDVRDVARAHVRALEVAGAAGQRFLITAGRYSYQEIVDLLSNSERIPKDVLENTLPRGTPGKGYAGDFVYEVENEKSKNVLGMKYHSLEESVVDAALQLIAVEDHRFV